jgi:hypothetical protein
MIQDNNQADEHGPVEPHCDLNTDATGGGDDPDDEPEEPSRAVPLLEGVPVAEVFDVPVPSSLRGRRFTYSVEGTGAVWRIRLIDWAMDTEQLLPEVYATEKEADQVAARLQRAVAAIDPPRRTSRKLHN